MSDLTTVHVRHTGELSFGVSNGRAELGTRWNPVDGAWLATELFLAGLGSCMLATLVDYAQTNDIDVTGCSVEVSGEAATRPMRFGRIQVTYHLPDGLTRPQIDALVRAGDRCKVHNTLHHHPEIVVDVERYSGSST